MSDSIPFLGRFRVRPMPAPEMRKDPLVDRWVLVSTDRLDRPQELSEPDASAHATGQCPFCAGNEHLTSDAVLTVADDAGRWRIRIVPNLFPAVRDVGDFALNMNGVHTVGAGTGLHEVVVEAPHHEKSLANLSAEHVGELFRAYARRFQSARSDPRWVYPLVFKNHGAAAGASLEHVHSQLVLMPFVPPEVQAEVRGCERYWTETRRCYYCDLARHERASERFVAESANFIAFLPFAGRFPFETCLLPKEHACHMDRLPDDRFRELGGLVQQVLRKLQRGLEDPPYNYLIHTSRFSAPEDSAYHWHLEIIPRVNNIGGFEWGTGCNINTVPPEQAAAYLRDVPGE